MPVGHETRPEDFVLGDAFAESSRKRRNRSSASWTRKGESSSSTTPASARQGFPETKCSGRDAREFVIPAEESEAFERCSPSSGGRATRARRSGHWQTKEGGRRLIAWSNKLMPGEDGAPLYLVTAGIDLTDRARSQRGENALEGDPEAKLAEIGQLAQEQRALRRVATLVASEASPERVFMAVSEEWLASCAVNASAVFRYEGDDTATIVGRHNRDNIGAFQLGERLPVDENTTIGRVLYTGAPARIDDWSGLAGDAAEADAADRLPLDGLRPIIVAGILWGAVAIASAEPLPPESEARLAAFCELVSLAVASAQARDDLRSSRARIVKAGDEQRRKLERNLHDGAQQRLVSLALMIRVAKAQLKTDPEAAAGSLETAAKELDLALEELRELARGLHPGALTEHGSGKRTRGPLEPSSDQRRDRRARGTTPAGVEATATTSCRRR